MLWKKALALIAGALFALLVYAIVLRRSATTTTALASRLRYPLRLKIFGPVLVGAAAVLVVLMAMGVIPGSATLPGIIVTTMLGLSGAWATYEGIGTHFDVFADRITKTSLFRRRSVDWTEITAIHVTRNKDAVVLAWREGRMTVSMRLENLATFSAAATAGIPQAVMKSCPAAATLIRQPLGRDSAAG